MKFLKFNNFINKNYDRGLGECNLSCLFLISLQLIRKKSFILLFRVPQNSGQLKACMVVNFRSRGIS